MEEEVSQKENYLLCLKDLAIEKEVIFKEGTFCTVNFIGQFKETDSIEITIKPKFPDTAGRKITLNKKQVEEYFSIVL